MKTLIVEDDFISRRILKDLLSPYGDCDIVVDGKEAIQAFEMAWQDGAPYDLICMDIMMPNVDGQESLSEIRKIEKKLGVPAEKEVKAIMVSALDDPKSVVRAFYDGGATAYLVKPIDKDKLLKEVRALGLIE